LLENKIDIKSNQATQAASPISNRLLSNFTDRELRLVAFSHLSLYKQESEKNPKARENTFIQREIDYCFFFFGPTIPKQRITNHK
jgi:hypothetical protein